MNFCHLYPFKSHFMDLDGLTYHYLDEGEGAPVVMLHGNPTWSFYYRDLVKAIAPQFRAIVPDHIGCGLSDKPDTERYDYRLKSRVNDLERLIDHLGLKEGIRLIVHDWGGMIGVIYALRHMERINRIVIMNTAGFFPPAGKRLPLRLWLVRNLLPFAVPAVLGLNLFSRAALYMASRKGLSKDVRAGLTAPYNSWNNRIATLRFVQDIPVTKKDPSYGLVKYADDNLHRLADIPMLICWGKHDFVFDAAYLAEWRRRFPHADVREFSDAGHYLLEDAADEIIPLIRDFLNQ
ncbi:alpha/beta fold hydrolase [Desulfobacterales bacterium HSG2]|nr:alpha/beta fold hydrolase [Desulfobacterales bacterium HSG2]